MDGVKNLDAFRRAGARGVGLLGRCTPGTGPSASDSGHIELGLLLGIRITSLDGGFGLDDVGPDVREERFDVVG
jgi:hypothetical protein